MCELCARAKSMPEYAGFMERMLAEDRMRLEGSGRMATELPPVAKALYSSMSWPVKLVYPMFEARAPYAVPNNYFQNLFVNDERLGNSFSHGAMRSLFFAGERLALFSKSVNFHDAKEFFTSFILLHLEKNEYQWTDASGELRITANVEKTMMNLVTCKPEHKRIAFSFMHQSVEGRMVSKESVASTTRFKEAYGKYAGGTAMMSASMDLEGYAVTVPHFSPHPYMLQLCGQFGHPNNKDFQLHAADYFRAHLK